MLTPCAVQVAGGAWSSGAEQMPDVLALFALVSSSSTQSPCRQIWQLQHSKLLMDRWKEQQSELDQYYYSSIYSDTTEQSLINTTELDQHSSICTPSLEHRLLMALASVLQHKPWQSTQAINTDCMTTSEEEVNWSDGSTWLLADEVNWLDPELRCMNRGGRRVELLLLVVSAERSTGGATGRSLWRTAGQVALLLL